MTPLLLLFLATTEGAYCTWESGTLPVPCNYPNQCFGSVCQNLCLNVNCSSPAVCDPDTGTCAANKCLGVRCGTNMLCHVADGLCYCDTAPCRNDQICSSQTFGRCSNSCGSCPANTFCSSRGECLCANSVCSANEQCAANTAGVYSCFCGSRPPCTGGQICVDNATVAGGKSCSSIGLCATVNCTDPSTVCQDTSGLCVSKCKSGAGCPSGEACLKSGATGGYICRCGNSSSCTNSACMNGQCVSQCNGQCPNNNGWSCAGLTGDCYCGSALCDPVTSICSSGCRPKCGGPCPTNEVCIYPFSTCSCGSSADCTGNNACLVNATGSLTCQATTLCVNVTCTAPLACDPSDGVCKCGSLMCASNEACVSVSSWTTKTYQCVSACNSGGGCSGDEVCVSGGQCKCGNGAACVYPSVCQQGLCVNQCAGIKCGINEVCDSMTSSCFCGSSAGCNSPLVCRSGSCANPCQGVICSPGSTCVANGTSHDCAQGDVNCVVSWGTFSSCIPSCGPGTKTRKGVIITLAQGNGLPCGSLTETVPCDNGVCTDSPTTKSPTNSPITNSPTPPPTTHAPSSSPITNSPITNAPSTSLPSTTSPTLSSSSSGASSSSSSTGNPDVSSATHWGSMIFFVMSTTFFATLAW